MSGSSSGAPARGWSGGGAATTLVLVRHGVTKHTSAKRFSGGLGGDNPPLTGEGRAQVTETATWLGRLRGEVAAVVASPVLRTRETGEILASALDAPVVEEPGFAELEFGVWDGLTFAEIAERYPAEMKAWFGNTDAAPPGGESFAEARTRVLAGLERVLETYAERTVVVTSHVTPIKLLVAEALGAPLDAGFKMELVPASVTVISYFADGRASLRLFNAVPPSRDGFVPGLG